MKSVRKRNHVKGDVKKQQFNVGLNLIHDIGKGLNFFELVSIFFCFKFIQQQAYWLLLLNLAWYKIVAKIFKQVLFASRSRKSTAMQLFAKNETKIKIRYKPYTEGWHADKIFTQIFFFFSEYLLHSFKIYW